MAGKKTILIVWDYKRRDLIAHFFSLEEKFNLVFLYYKEANGEKSDLNVLYWNQFSSPYEIIEKIDPFKILFVDIETYYEVALNLAAKNRGIKTYIIDHGLRDPEEVGFSVERGKAASSGSSNTENVSSSPSGNTAGFYFKAFRPKNIIHLIQFMLFAYIRRKHEPIAALYKCRFRFRWPSNYLSYSEKNKQFFQLRDGAPDDQFKMIGNPAFDEIFNLKDLIEPGDQMLFIDSPLELSSLFSAGVDQKRVLFSALNEYCMKKGLKLRIKLHPHSYGKPRVFEHSNISYTEAGNTNELILASRECSGFHSTLMIAAIVLRPCTIFRIDDYPFQENVASLGVAQVLNMDNLKPEMIEPVQLERDDKRMQQFINWYLYKTDGKSLERLRSFIVN